jgi:hypothetical protein
MRLAAFVVSVEIFSSGVVLFSENIEKTMLKNPAPAVLEKSTHANGYTIAVR